MNSIENAIYDYLLKNASIEPIGVLPVNSQLKDIGVNSLKFVLMMLQMELALGIKAFDKNNIINIQTVGDVLALLEKAATAQLSAPSTNNIARETVNDVRSN